MATEKSGKTPKVFMLTIGNLAMRLARSQFSANFFACAGYKIIDNLGFDTVEAGVEAAVKAGAEIVVLCSSDDEYAEFAPAAYKALAGRAEFVVAGAPALTAASTPASTVSKPKLSIILYPAQAKKLAENCERAKRIAKLPIVNINTFGVLPLFSVAIRKASNSEAPREKSRAGIVASPQ
jgi:hypothetical protein